MMAPSRALSDASGCGTRGPGICILSLAVSANAAAGIIAMISVRAETPLISAMNNPYSRKAYSTRGSTLFIMSEEWGPAVVFEVPCVEVVVLW
jgi:hypothetical protein